MTSDLDIYRTANLLLPASILVMLGGAYVGFIGHEAFTLSQQVTAHISIMLGALVLKVGYVMHLNASKHLKLGEFARV